MKPVSDWAIETWKRSKWEFTCKGISNWLSIPVFFEKTEFLFPPRLIELVEALLAIFFLGLVIIILYPPYVLWVLFYHYPRMIIRTRHQINKDTK